MQGDFSRDSFDPAKHYAAVLKQQGRVDLDADWNEHTAIERYVEETTTMDVVGPCGAPQENAGFQIGYTETGVSPDLTISAGRIYVEGILCELESPTTYLGQADHPVPPALAPQPDRTDLIYLDVWQRHITQIEDPDLREVALGGPDTATRIQTVCQVKVKTNVGKVTCADDVPGWPPSSSGGLLTALSIETETPENLCAPAAAGGYQGLENRLYRVEIHQGGAIGKATFKWSRDNGSVVYAIDEFIDGQPNQVRLSSIGRDRVLKLHVGDWVEVLDDATELSSEGPGMLAWITDLDEAERLITLSASISGLELARHPKVRRWDQGQDAITITNETFDLEDGIQVTLSGSGFKTGDYWISAARSITGKIEELTGAPPKGIEHYYCALALVTWHQESGQWAPTIHDCRNLFPPLTGLTRFFYVGGNGQEAMPGQPLPELLRVGVMNGQQPVEGALVSFAADKPGARVAETIAGLAAATESSITLATGPDGIASCAWQLDNDITDPSQALTATLLDASEVATEHPPIHFNANLSIASQVWYNSKGCINPNNPGDVQEALDDLCQNYSIYYVGGDGQDAMPGKPVLFPLQVRIANGQWSVADVKVTFRVTKGGGSVSGGSGSGLETTVITNAVGIASAQWTLGSSDPQQVLAFMAERENLNVAFNANLSIASQVWYNSKGCINPNNPGDVQEALDDLCQNYSIYYVGGDGQDAMPGKPVPFPLQVRIANGQWSVADVKVTFRVTKGGGSVSGGSGSGLETIINTNAEGVASAQWTLGSSDPQQVLAFMEERENLNVVFNATLLTADSISFDPKNCEHFDDSVTNVQAAIDALCKLGLGTEPGIRVTDIILSGQNATLLNDSYVPVDVFAAGLRIVCDRPPDPNSLVNKPVCFITLELPYPLNQADRDLWHVDTLIGFQPIILAASLRTVAPAPAITVSPAGGIPASLRTVAPAPAIAVSPAGGIPGDTITVAPAPAITVSPASGIPGSTITIAGTGFTPSAAVEITFAVQITFGTAALATAETDSQGRFSTTATVPNLPRGIQTVTATDPAVSASAPYAISSENLILWNPAGPTRLWLLNRLFDVADAKMPERVLARLTLKGNFVWDLENREMYLDGDGYGAPAQGRTDLVLPTGNGLCGGDLEMWFWLVPKAEEGPALVAVNDSTNTVRGTPITIDVLANDSGAKPLSIASVTQPPSGSAVTFTGNSVTYIPATGFIGKDTFSYTVRDVSGKTAQATVTVTVVGPTIPTGGVPTGVPTDVPVVDRPNTPLVSGATTEVSGSGFRPNEEVTVAAMTVEGTALELGSVTTDSTGAFRTDLRVSETIPSGDYTIKAVGERGSQSGTTDTIKISNRTGSRTGARRLNLFTHLLTQALGRKAERLK